MTKIINTTPHPCTFQDERENIYEVEPCGAVISARPVEEPAGRHKSGAELVRTRFEATPEAEAELSRLERESPGAVIVGSIIAAQAFPGRVLALVPAPGYERVPPAEKRMRADKFTTFAQHSVARECNCGSGDPASNCPGNSLYFPTWKYCG